MKKAYIIPSTCSITMEDELEIARVSGADGLNGTIGETSGDTEADTKEDVWADVWNREPVFQSNLNGCM